MGAQTGDQLKQRRETRSAGGKPGAQEGEDLPNLARAADLPRHSPKLKSDSRTNKNHTKQATNLDQVCGMGPLNPEAKVRDPQTPKLLSHSKL